MLQSRVIDEFKGDFSFLSNFYHSPIQYKNPYDLSGDLVSFPTVEHAYQANKAKDGQAFEFVTAATSPGMAKRRGREIEMREDWDYIKALVMHTLVRKKFQDHTDLMEKLLQTANWWLIEGNTWGDKYWGKVDGVGENMLGKILTKVRTEERIQRQWWRLNQ